MKAVSQDFFERDPKSVETYVIAIVITTALATLLLWSFINPSYAIANALSVLIIASPFTFTLASALPYKIGLKRRFEKGFLIKDRSVFEKLEKAKTLVIDSTDFLFEGIPHVMHIVSNFAHSKDEVLSLAAALEKESGTSLGQALLTAVEKRQITIPFLDDVSFTPNCGVTGRILNNEIAFGKKEWLESLNVFGVASLNELADEFRKQAQKIFFVTLNQEAVGFIAFSDPPKVSSEPAIRELHEMGIKTILITKDNELIARAAAKELGISEYRWGVAPDFKKDLYTSLAEKGYLALLGKRVGLSEKSISISMEAESEELRSDIHLVKGDLLSLAKAFTLGKKIMQVRRQNFIFALLYNFMAIAIAAGLLYPFFGLLVPPIAAIVAMGLSYLFVIINSTCRLK